MGMLGIDRLLAEGPGERWKGQTIGLLCNQASTASDCVHVLDHLLPHHRSGELAIGAVFGPQHGIWGHTQDNMIEWEGYLDPRTGLLFHSLYGLHRKPVPAMLEGLDRMVIDIPDVGSRYYTFIWTMCLCMEACAEAGIPVTVLDRPNPINGVTVEGPVLDPAYASFVGLHPLPVRHAKTTGETALWLRGLLSLDLDLEVVEVEGWDRTLYLDETDFLWVVPSPNMPAVETAVVYPGMCLLEGTNLSEGRGTTRPFETFGAPWIDGWQLAEALNSAGLEGCVFRPVQFLPTFNKHMDSLCQGCFIHVVDRRSFRPFLAGCTVLQTVNRLYPESFRWNDPPYEYEEKLMPIDILLGCGWLRGKIEADEDLRQILDQPNG